jgi:tyrosinase
MRYTRRSFLTTTAATASLLALGTRSGFAADRTGSAKPARWRRHDVASDEGQRMLDSYARGVQAMLNLPASDPRNWFRNAFTHMMDCPHGNWWFYAWHRGYVGYFEQTIRELSGDKDFAIPYWDWTRQPEIPARMFDGPLTPTDAAFAPYTRNLAVFTKFIQPALKDEWKRLSSDQRDQLSARGYCTFDQLWNDVTGYSTKNDAGISGNMAYAITCGARYLSRDNAALDEKTKQAVALNTILAGLAPFDFQNATASLSFTSSRTASHLVPPDGSTQFSVLEGMPHNKVHNCIGGVGAVDPGPYGNMTNFLSPVDPIFFLHHANMDRLWDVWTRKQRALGLPIGPEGADEEPFMSEPFLFYVQANGTPLGQTTARAVFSTEAFDYDYAPATGSDYIPRPRLRSQAAALNASVDEDSASLTVPKALADRHVATAQAPLLIAEITLDRPEGLAVAREFDVLVNAPADVERVDHDSPYYAGTVSFFGPGMPGMAMSHTTTFTLPLPRRLQALVQAQAAGATLDIRLVPSSGQADAAPKVRALKLVPVG